MSKRYLAVTMRPCDADDNRANGIGPGMESEFDEPRVNPNGVMARSSLNIQSKSEAAKQNYNLSPSKKTEAAPSEDDRMGLKNTRLRMMERSGTLRTSIAQSHI